MGISRVWNVVGACAAVTAAIATSGCGNLTDKDLIEIGTLDGAPITRGDLRRLIRDMPDDARPVIRNRADLLRTLSKYIDETILDAEAFLLRSDRKIDVPREQAKAVYFARVPSDRAIYEVRDAQQLQEEEYDVSEGQLSAFQAEIEFKIDDVEQELLREAALNYLIADAYQTGRINITDEEFQAEYELYKDRLFFYERLGFVGVRFMAVVGDAAKQAADCRARIDAGESFDSVLGIYASINKAMIIESSIENNPNLPRFQGFWAKASGAQVGDIIGPVFMPEYEVLGMAEDGVTPKKFAEPASYMVIQIRERIEPRGKTWQEARADLAPMILRRKVMRELRDAHGVEIYEEKLPDPGRYESELEGPFIDVE